MLQIYRKLKKGVQWADFNTYLTIQNQWRDQARPKAQMKTSFTNVLYVEIQMGEGNKVNGKINRW